MDVHLVDGTYELFRHFFAVPSGLDEKGNEIGALRGVLTSVVRMIEEGATHLGVATDHVIESFRNGLYPGYKTLAGIPEALFSQFHPLEKALQTMGVMVWPMVEFEADDAMAAAAAKAARDHRVTQVIVCTPDKDLAQCVAGSRVVQLDRRRGILRDEAGVVSKWGVRPESIPEFLAVVGDAADGYPGLPGWGPKAAALTFSQYPHFEDVPKDWRQWHPSIRGAQRLSTVLFEQWDDAILFRTLATLRLDVPVFESVDELEWKGPLPEFEPYCEHIQAAGLHARVMAALRPPQVSLSNHDGVLFVEGPQRRKLLRTIEDISLVLEACFSGGVNAALLYSANLPAGFFDLSSGEAGAILQKLRNYGIRLAVVRAADVPISSRFPEMVAEESRGGYFAMFESAQAAREWLSAN